MSSHSRDLGHCQVCTTNSSKYTCSKCYVAYCSVPCYKQHQPCTNAESTELTETKARDVPVGLPSQPSLGPGTCENLRPLTSLKWPYAPEESAYPDPLKRDDPKDLQLRQYEAIATSPKIREVLSKHENLPALLTSVDKLRGIEREQALHKALGVTPPDIDGWRKPTELSEDVLALRELAEVVEAAIRGGNESALGLNWGE
ncbi:hypothetical protein P691DRAFT_728376 [Macrolepiota fuliginosa MF-IS2]|uniref:HIT-type domain-containing protein n=1 Tax=Macrolepiota fuliginosa MF-IS2 TaxID=1400762 RepID=A0A9P5XG46_9AGAR|nr:hypothetical protein P691DRAFT_728376 [Macrolepiota fuliginosa MF-IS2]